MSKPTTKAWEKLRRVGKYLKMQPRLVWKYEWQQPQTIIDIHSDANWAGCHLTRKSTIGNHYLTSWAKTQATIAKSSAESELYGVVRASMEGLGMSALFGDFGENDVHIRIYMDASAAIGIVERQGLNKVRHIDVDI